jgi:hypothetical protein
MEDWESCSEETCQMYLVHYSGFAARIGNE